MTASFSQFISLPSPSPSDMHPHLIGLHCNNSILDLLIRRHGQEGLPSVASLVLPKSGQRQLSQAGHARIERSMQNVEDWHFNGERPSMSSEPFQHALRSLAEYEVARLTQVCIHSISFAEFTCLAVLMVIFWVKMVFAVVSECHLCEYMTLHLS